MKAYGLELVVAPGQKRVVFPDIAMLRNKVIKYFTKINVISYGKSGLPITNINGFVTLRDKDSSKDSFEKMPLTNFGFIDNIDRIKFNKKFDLNKSYIDLNESPLAQSCLYFVIWYDENTCVRKSKNSKSDISFFERKLTTGRNYLNDENKLKGRKIKSMLPSKYNPLTPNGNETVSYNTLRKCFLTLVKNNVQIFKDIPIMAFYENTISNIIDLKDLEFDFVNSYIDIVNPQAGDFKSVFFNVVLEG